MYVQKNNLNKEYNANKNENINKVKSEMKKDQK